MPRLERFSKVSDGQKWAIGFKDGEEIWEKGSKFVDEMVKGLPNIPDEYKPLVRLVNNKPIIASVSPTK